MGSRIVTKGRAAEMLGVDLRSVQRYMAQGLLRTEFVGKKILVLEEDVLKLKRVKSEGHKVPRSRDTLPMILARVQALENQVSTMARILNIKYEELNLTESEYQILHQMAEVYSAQGWPPQAEEQWADTFCRMKLEDLEKLEDATKDPHPWRPFLRLVTTMHVNSYVKELRDQFAAGRNNIHAIASIWCNLKGESPKSFDLLVQKDTAPIKKLMRQLSKTRQ